MQDSFLCAFCECHAACLSKGACQDPDGTNEGWLDREIELAEKAKDTEVVSV